ncbi:DUF1905 domain-containing protein [Aestuariimicrobium sp. Y1814]|uniref:DUF1905 domain-containing protein n=1 Tax=Aestuariimicrobium sp. Y1814 TaxID=3418742 RepID=UPI003DA724BF
MKPTGEQPPREDIGEFEALDPIDFRFTGEVIEWRGPAPFHFVVLPLDAAEEVFEETHLSYGWGMIPATITVGDTTWYTALWRKQGTYYIPLKDAVRTAEDLHLGDVIEVYLKLGRD